MDVSRGWTWEIDTDGYSNYEGRIILRASEVADYYWVITEKRMNADGSGVWVLAPDPTVTQPGGVEGGIKASVAFTPSYIGLNLVFKTIDQNQFTFDTDTICNLRWVGVDNN